MSGLDRFVAVLSLYSDAVPAWSVQDMALQLGQPASTVYRTVRDLVSASFLEPVTGARYRLGAAFPHFDRVARSTDPVVRAGGPFLHDIVAQARVPCVAMLSRLCNDMIICVDHASSASAAFEWSLFERGRPIPLTLGSSSKVILAQLTPPQRRKLLTARCPEDVATDLVARNDLFTAIRRQGYYISHGEIDPSVSAIAAPIAVPELGIAASVNLIVEQGLMNEELERRLVLLLVSSAGLLTDRLRRLEETLPAPAPVPVSRAG